MDSSGLPKKNTFLVRNPEKSDLNQYWFSQKTIQFLVGVAVKHGKSSAFLSTPSVYFSLPESARGSSYVFDFDRKFEKDPNYVFYDFNKPEEIPSKFESSFDFLLIDPPFITREVWEKYAQAIKRLVKKSEDGKEITGKILLCSIAENEQMLKELLGVSKRAFKPSIPTLVYQYNFYSNFESEELGEVNPEIDF